MPLRYTASSAPNMAKGTAVITASGKDQRSYCARKAQKEPTERPPDERDAEHGAASAVSARNSAPSEAGGRGCLSRPRGGVAFCPRRSRQHRPVEGDVSDRA